jgi:hypothetical protein
LQFALSARRSRLEVSISCSPERGAGGVALIACAIVAADSAQALAHEVIPGVTGFPGLMLHPFVIPEQMLSLAAAGVLAGRVARVGLPVLIAALIAGMIAGKAVHLAFPLASAYWFLPALAVLVAGALTAAGTLVPRLPGLLAIILIGGVVSIAILPEEPNRLGLLRSLLATIVTGSIVVAALACPLRRVSGGWAAIGVRAAGAWLGAAAVMQLALSWRLFAGW